MSPGGEEKSCEAERPTVLGERGGGRRPRKTGPVGSAAPSPLSLCSSLSSRTTIPPRSPAPQPYTTSPRTCSTPSGGCSCRAAVRSRSSAAPPPSPPSPPSPGPPQPTFACLRAAAAADVWAPAPARPFAYGRWPFATASATAPLACLGQSRRSATAFSIAARSRPPRAGSDMTSPPSTLRAARGGGGRWGRQAVGTNAVRMFIGGPQGCMRMGGQSRRSSGSGCLRRRRPGWGGLVPGAGGPFHSPQVKVKVGAAHEGEGDAREERQLLWVAGGGSGVCSQQTAIPTAQQSVCERGGQWLTLGGALLGGVGRGGEGGAPGPRSPALGRGRRLPAACCLLPAAGGAPMMGDSTRRSSKARCTRVMARVAPGTCVERACVSGGGGGGG